MGTYLPAKRRPKRSVSDALREAEEDHFLDCPQAPFLQRAAAFFLDCIFLFLIWSATRRLSIAMESVISHWLQPLRYALTCVFFWHYGIWTLPRFGGSPGKLLLGLRVVNVLSGQRLGLREALLRELIGKVLSFCTLGFGFFLPLLRQDMRALHDLISASTVKKIRGGP
ncbi:MAG: RDD family protein [Deltaproteobacteria bacterium]|nr:RDD family protein [Deltaproteobacteria bacterium]